MADNTRPRDYKVPPATIAPLDSDLAEQYKPTEKPRGLKEWEAETEGYYSFVTRELYMARRHKSTMTGTYATLYASQGLQLTGSYEGLVKEETEALSAREKEIYETEHYSSLETQSKKLLTAYEREILELEYNIGQYEEQYRSDLKSYKESLKGDYFSNAFKLEEFEAAYPEYKDYESKYERASATYEQIYSRYEELSKMSPEQLFEAYFEGDMGLGLGSELYLEYGEAIGLPETIGKYPKGLTSRYQGGLGTTAHYAGAGGGKYTWEEVKAERERSMYSY